MTPCRRAQNPEKCVENNGKLHLALVSARHEAGLFNFPVTHFIVAAIPEPATLAILSLGLAGLGYARRKKAA